MKIFYLLLSLTLFLSCKKHEKQKNKNEEPCIIVSTSNTNTVLKTTDYLVAKPGSWWKYSGGTQLNCENPDFEPVYTLIEESNSCKYIDKDMNIAPIHPYFGAHNGRFAVMNKSYHDVTIFQPIYDTVEGQFYSYEKHVNSAINTQERTISETREVLGILDSMEVNGEIYSDVLHIRHHKKKYYYYNYQDYAPDEVTEFYLAKGVGLIELHHHNGPVHTDFTLVDYYID